MDLARHGTRPPPRPGTRGLSLCLPGRSAREGLGLPPAGTGGQRSRNSTPDARTVDQALQIPCPHVQENGEWAVYALAAIPHADVERLSKFRRARPVHMPTRPRAARRSDGARARRNQRPALGDGSINRSASRKLDLPPTRRNGSTSSIRDPSAAQGTRGYFRESFPSGYIESNTNRVAGLPRWPPTHRCAACGVANGPTTLVSHVSFAGFPCGNAYWLEQALPGD